MAAPAPADPNLNREMDELAAQMNNLNIGRNPQNPAVPPVAVPDAAPIAAMPAALPVQNFEEPQVVPNAPPSIQYDLDHDVVMRTPYHYNLTQIPEPGFFSGNPNETDLFCELCEATFTTYPNNELPEPAKINFVKTRLRGSARNWYLSKYKHNIVPSTMGELLTGLRNAFNNVGSTKLAKIKLVTLKHNYGNINNYIERFRTYSQMLGFGEESLALLFYVGLHPKYQEEIQKLDLFPNTFESIITKCILFENSLKTMKEIKETINHNKNKNRSNYHNNIHENNNNYNKKNNNFKIKNNKSENENQIKAQKINSKN